MKYIDEGELFKYHRVQYVFVFQNSMILEKISDGSLWGVDFIEKDNKKQYFNLHRGKGIDFIRGAS